MSQPFQDRDSTRTSAFTQLADFARSLRDTRRSMSETLDEILRYATGLLDGADIGCITTLTKGKRTVVASTDSLAEELCRFQYESGDGPIATEVRDIEIIVADDLESETRWPQFATTATQNGIRSLVAFQLYSNGEDVGALVLYGRTARAFSSDVVAVGEALAAHAAVALLGARDNEQFERGLASRDIIGQAKGMIMERYDIDAIQAFDLLAKLSQQQNLPLNRIARELVESSHPTTSIT